MAQSRCSLRYVHLFQFPLSLSLSLCLGFSLLFLCIANLLVSAIFDRCSSSGIGDLRRPWFQAQEPFLQGGQFRRPSFNSYIDGSIHSLLNSEKAHYFCFVIVNLCVYVCVWGLKVWHTASLYHLVHTAALLAAPITTRPNIVSIHSFPLFLLLLLLFFCYNFIYLLILFLLSLEAFWLLESSHFLGRKFLFLILYLNFASSSS